MSEDERREGEAMQEAPHGEPLEAAGGVLRFDIGGDSRSAPAAFLLAPESDAPLLIEIL